MRFLHILSVAVLLAMLSACAHKPMLTTHPAAGLKTNAQGVALIKHSEGLRLNAYREGNHWLIGYGHVLGSKPTSAITEAEAERLLRGDLAECETAITAVVSVPVTSNEFGAMVSLCYSVGTAAFAQSTLVDCLNKGDRRGAADNFLRWTKARVNGRKVTIPHLETRRRKEKALFLTP